MSWKDSRLRLLDHDSLDSASDDYSSEGYDAFATGYDSDCSSISSTTLTAYSGGSRSPPTSPPPPTHQPPLRRPQLPENGAVGGSAEVMTFHSQEPLLESLTYITSMKEMCDVIFHVGHTRYPLYGVKAILSARSRVMFQNILHAQRTAASSGTKSSKREKRKRGRRQSVDKDVDDGRVHIDVTNYDVNVFSRLVGFLHSGQVRVDETTVLGLYCAATEYEVQDLRSACYDFVLRCVQRGHAQSLMTSDRHYLSRPALNPLLRTIFPAKWEKTPY